MAAMNFSFRPTGRGLRLKHLHKSGNWAFALASVMTCLSSLVMANSKALSNSFCWRCQCIHVMRRRSSSCSLSACARNCFCTTIDAFSIFSFSFSPLTFWPRTRACILAAAAACSAVADWSVASTSARDASIASRSARVMVYASALSNSPFTFAAFIRSTRSFESSTSWISSADSARVSAMSHSYSLMASLNFSSRRASSACFDSPTKQAHRPFDART
mmetsp:Transcript_6762/g.16508  ORF Transcript_6762/g.16508 Transcript_6762/m.16508 type:complete len:218 (+) Transcript_6762:372-1025(+)